MAEQANGQTGGGKNSNSKAIVILLVVIIVLLAVVIGVFAALLLKKDNTAERETVEKRNVVITQENAEEQAEELFKQEYVPTGYYETVMSTTWTFATGDAVSEDAYVANDEANTNDVYFDVFLASDESTPILQSPIIPVGEEYTGIKLDTPLDAGTYDCVCIYHLVDENQETLSTLRVGFKIIVEQ